MAYEIPTVHVTSLNLLGVVISSIPWCCHFINTRLEISERSSRTSHAELRDLTYITSKVFVFSFVLFSGFDFLSNSLLVIEYFVEYGEGFKTK